jgi:hypothetical protein
MTKMALLVLDQGLHMGLPNVDLETGFLKQQKVSINQVFGSL